MRASLVDSVVFQRVIMPVKIIEFNEGDSALPPKLNDSHF